MKQNKIKHNFSTKYNITRRKKQKKKKIYSKLKNIKLSLIQSLSNQFIP